MFLFVFMIIFLTECLMYMSKLIQNYYAFREKIVLHISRSLKMHGPIL